MLCAETPSADCAAFMPERLIAEIDEAIGRFSSSRPRRARLVQRTKSRWPEMRAVVDPESRDARAV